MAADETPRSEQIEPPAQPSPHIRLRVDLVVEIADADVLTRSALDHVARDELMPDEERAHAEEIINGDAGEALACLVDPFDLVRELPGVELAHASWGSEEMDAAEVDAFSFLDGADDPGDEADEEVPGSSGYAQEAGADLAEALGGGVPAVHADGHADGHDDGHDGHDDHRRDVPGDVPESVHGLGGVSR